MKTIIRFFIQIRDFFLCFLAYIFSALAIYMVIADKVQMFPETLGFIAILLGIRAYERLKTTGENKNNVNTNI